MAQKVGGRKNSICGLKIGGIIEKIDNVYDDFYVKNIFLKMRES